MYEHSTIGNKIKGKRGRKKKLNLGQELRWDHRSCAIHEAFEVGLHRSFVEDHDWERVGEREGGREREVALILSPISLANRKKESQGREEGNRAREKGI